MVRLGLVWLCLLLGLLTVHGFIPGSSRHDNSRAGFIITASNRDLSGAGSRHQGGNGVVSRRAAAPMMIFEFIRQRSVEGIKQVQNIASKTAEGKLGEALEDTAAYVKERQEIDYKNFQKLKDGLAKSRANLLVGIEGFLGIKNEELDGALEKLEEVLMMADIGAATTMEIIDDLRTVAKAEGLEPDDVKSVLRGKLIEVLSSRDMSMKVAKAKFEEQALKQFDGDTSDLERYPRVLFVIGANGMGKTTTIGKFAARLKREANQTVLVAACDTFRAAAVDQLAEWTERAGVDIHRPTSTQDRPGPVLQDALDRAIREKYDVVIVDTSGRLSNNVKLNEELKKLKTIITTKVPGGPHETLLVLDGAVGRNGVDQAKIWNREVGVTGLCITKLDGTARGGVVVSIVRDLGVPVKMIGVGEGIEDLRDFDPPSFVDALLGYEPEAAAALESRLQGMIEKSLIKPAAVSKTPDSPGSSSASPAAKKFPSRTSRSKGGSKKKKR